MNKDEYREYLQTIEWKNRRDEELKKACNKCQMCGGSDSLQVHHLSYESLNPNFPGEEDSADLIVLCEKCHMELHKCMDMMSWRVDPFNERYAAEWAANTEYKRKLDERLVEKFSAKAMDIVGEFFRLFLCNIEMHDRKMTQSESGQHSQALYKIALSLARRFVPKIEYEDVVSEVRDSYRKFKKVLKEQKDRSEE